MLTNHYCEKCEEQGSVEVIDYQNEIAMIGQEGWLLTRCNACGHQRKIALKSFSKEFVLEAVEKIYKKKHAQNNPPNSINIDGNDMELNENGIYESDNGEFYCFDPSEWDLPEEKGNLGEYYDEYGQEDYSDYED